MNALQMILRLPGFSSLIGAMAIIALVWYLGPLLVIGGEAPLASQKNRMIVAVVILALFAAYLLTKWLLARRKNRKMTKELARSEDPVEIQTKEEIATLNKVFDQALKELKQIGGKRGDLYQLPWYVIIGPPGSGKTTALINSGLNFPLAKRLGTSKIKGIGGTRNCDWWFTDQAVLLDTAGRYTTQDSQEAVDSAAWQNFLKLLKKYRKRRPINGVLIAISLSDLLQQNETERSLHALTIRKRIQELHEQFDIRFPVYVLFTKVDLIAGSMEFFDDLGSEERAQVWGMSFPLDEGKPEGDSAVVHFEREFELLEQRLSQRLLRRLQEERDPQRRDLIYAFPQQFSALKGVAKTFLEELFLPSRFEQRALLRGVYFTSGTQEGNPIDRLMGALAGTFGVARQTLPSFSGQGRSYFLNRLFRDVVFQESGLAGTNFSLERKRLWLGRAGYAAVGLLTLGLGVAWFSSYATNSSYVDDVDRQLAELTAATEQLDPEQRELTAILPVLDQARSIPGATGQPPDSSWIAHLGLYQGDKLGASAATAYRNLLDRAFLSRLIVRIEERIKTELRREQTDQQTLYDALKVYLMLDRSADRPYAPVFVERWMSRDWAADPSFDEAARQRLDAHLASLLEQLPDSLPLVPDQDLIARARARLPGELNAEQIYQQLLRADHGIAEFRVAEVAGPDVAEVFYRVSGAPLSSGVAGIFTQPGQVVFANQVQARVQELADGDWVLALPPQPEAELQQRAARMQELYWRDYCPQWEQLLADLDIRAPRNTLQNVIDRLYALSGPNSPLRSLLRAVVEQTRSVPQCLQDLSRLIGGESPTGLDQLLTELDELAVQLSPLAKAKAEGRSIERESANDVLARLEQLPRGKPPPVDRWLRSVTEPVPIYLYEGLRAYINSVWRRDVLGFCERALGNRYPIVATSHQDVSLADFGRFFGPDGIIDRFINQGDHRFTTFVDMSKTPWEWRAFDNNPGIPREKLAELQFATEVRQAFFPGGNQNPSVSFRLKPDAIDPRLDRVMLELDGQAVSFTATTSASVPLQWPGPSPGHASMQLFTGSGAPLNLEEIGPWAWFRLLDRARLRPLASDVFELAFQPGGYTVRLELQASSVFNPFGLELESFRCLQTL